MAQIASTGLVPTLANRLEPEADSLGLSGGPELDHVRPCLAARLSAKRGISGD